MGIGSGGRRSTAAKKSASQRTGLRSVHQRRGTIAAGAARAAFKGRLRVRAIAAAHMPKSAGAHQAGRGCDALVKDDLNAETQRTQRKAQRKPTQS
jgi:hypothetical protein